MSDDRHLSLRLSPGHYAFAATTAVGFAFVERQVEASGNPVIALSSDCHLLRGRIVGAIALPATVVISRVSNSTGDVFLAEPSSSGYFAACLPDAAYAVRIQGSTASLTTPLVMPTDTVDLAAYATSQIQQVPVGIHIEDVDFTSFAGKLIARRLVGLGESNHGTGDFYSYREKLTLQLARAGKLRTILLENDAIGTLAIDDYVMGKEIDIAKAVAALRFWTTDTQEFLTLLSDIRAYNVSASAFDKIHVLGIDAQRLEPPVQFLLAHRTEIAIADHEGELLSRIPQNRGKEFLRLTNADQAVLSSLLDRLSSPQNLRDVQHDIVRASIAARSIRYQLGYITHRSTIGLRDQAMSELAAYVVGLRDSSQAAIWAHNGHIARQSDDADKSLGQYLAEKFGEAYYPIAFLSYSGSARAWDKAGKIGVIPHDLAPTPRYNVESVIMEASRFADVAWVNLDVSNESLKRWLSVPRYVREFGSAYDPDAIQTLRSFPEAFAAVVVIQRTSPSTPTATGIRIIAK